MYLIWQFTLLGVPVIDKDHLVMIISIRLFVLINYIGQNIVHLCSSLHILI